MTRWMLVLMVLTLTLPTVAHASDLEQRVFELEQRALDLEWQALAAQQRAIDAEMQALSGARRRAECDLRDPPHAVLRAIGSGRGPTVYPASRGACTIDASALPPTGGYVDPHAARGPGADVLRCAERLLVESDRTGALLGSSISSLFSL